MVGFEEVWKNAGVDIGPEPFMVVILGQPNFVYFNVPKGGRLPAAPPGLTVTDVTDQTASRLYVEMTSSGLSKEFLADMRTLMMGRPLPPRGTARRLLMIRGNNTGRIKLRASQAVLDIAVVKPKTVSVAFKHVRYRDPQGNPHGTHWGPEQAPKIVGELNSIFYPQAGVSFALTSAAPLVLEDPLGPKVGDPVYDRLLAGKRDGTAAVTVFLVGKYDRANGTTKSHGDKRAILVNDKPDRFHKDIDPFINTLAHELAHAMGAEHTSRNNVLMTDGTGITSLKISGKTVREIHGIKS